MESPHNKTVPSFKLMVIGDVGSGKKEFMQRIFTGAFVRTYVAYMGVPFHVVEINSTQGLIRFHVWEKTDEENWGVFQNNPYYKPDSAIILVDMTSRVTFQHVPNYMRDLSRLCGNNLPITLCGTRVGNPTRKIEAKNMKFKNKLKIRLFDVSQHTNFNYGLPFLWLARKLMQDDTLQFKDITTASPSQFDLSWQENSNMELEESAIYSMLDEDDDDL